MIIANEDFATIIDGVLYFGNVKPAKNKETLLDLGITSILDLIKYKKPEDEIKHGKNFNFLHLSVEDSPTNSIYWCEQSSRFIENEIKKGGKVYVHCLQGISRSTTAILHYLMTCCGDTLKEAFDLVRSRRKVACPVYGFMKDLSELDKKLHKKVSFSPEEYSILAISEVFPSVSKDNVKATYNESKEIVAKNKAFYDKESVEKNIEPIGYLCIEKLIDKFGAENKIRRYGCSENHPFD